MPEPETREGAPIPAAVSASQGPRPDPALAAAPRLRLERRLVIGLGVALVVLRSAVLVWFEGAAFDSDQALLGLMAKHLMEGRAFPVFTYGQTYMLGLQAWLAAPLFAVAGMSVATLKLPLLAVNVAIAVVLILGIERSTGLRPVLAFLPALFFILAPPGTAVLMLDAGGSIVEPLLWVLLLWIVRDRPLLFGAVLALGVLQRPFTAYALGAFTLLRLADRSLFRRERWRPLVVAAVSFGAVWQGIYLLTQYSSPAGPGTGMGDTPVRAGASVAATVKFFCLDLVAVPRGLLTLVTAHLATLFGAEHRPLMQLGINTMVDQGRDWMWPVLGGVFLLMTLRLAWKTVRGEIRPWQPPLDFATYLWLVGLVALGVHVLSRCGDVDIQTMRYSVLGVFSAVGLTAAYLTCERSRWWKGLVVAVVLLWAASSAADHARLAAEYLFDRPPNARRVLADELVARGIRFGYADFWDAYVTVFLANEQVILASTSVSFVDEYQWLVAAHAPDAVWISRQPCKGGIPVAGGGYHICPPGS